MKKLFLFVLLMGFLFAKESQDLKQALFLMQRGQIEESIEKYRRTCESLKEYDFEILQQMGLILLQQGIRSEDSQTIMMTLFGAGLSGSTGALDILEKGLSHPDPQIQMLALHFIAKFDDDRRADIFSRAMSSDFLAIRMEAAFYMAQMKHPHAVGQIESLLYRLPPPFRPFFPSLFALLGTSDATHSLRRLLEDVDPQTRIESILNVAKLHRDDFLPLLRRRLTHAHIAELEASAFAIGALQDSHSIERLKRLAKSPTETVRIAASLALFNLKERSFVPVIEKLALEENLFASAALASIPGSEEILKTLLKSEQLQVRLNAAFSLLQRKDPACLPQILEILIQDARDLAFYPMPSVGRTLLAIKAVPSAEIRAKDPTLDLSYSLALKEQVLRDSLHLPDQDFLRIVSEIFEKKQNDLVPLAISLLENLQTEEAIELLKKTAKKMNAPFIRDYCQLALFRLKEKGPYEELVKNWILNQKGKDLIQLRKLLPWKYRMDQSDYSLSAEETSKLLIDSFLAMASQRDQENIAFLLKVIEKGNPYSRYALMGLLMKATE